MYVRLPALLVAVIAVAAASGCDDATAIKAQFPTDTDTLTLFALNGSPATAPSALYIRTGSAIRVDPTFSFDIAFDIDAQGQVIVYTQRAVASQQVTGHPVGLQIRPETFEQLTKAPTGNFVYDSSKVLPVGQLLVVDVLDLSCPQFSIMGQNIRAKLVVDSIVPSLRTIHVRMLSNPNCGFRDLIPGTPKE